MQSHRDLIVWQRSMQLVRQVYELTRRFPREELYGLTSQLRRATVSIPANISEGHGRGTRRDYAHFVTMAMGSACEVETLLETSVIVGIVSYDEIRICAGLLDETGRMLRVLRRRLLSRE
ncbi:four helix bundle protein [bacterium]|nr:four helix bundle protein [bacterium]